MTQEYQVEQPFPGFTDAQLYPQLDVRDEISRTYIFDTNKAYRIDLPLVVAVKKTARGDTHRVIDSAGVCHYIPAGWIAIAWTLKADTAIPLPDLSEQMSEAQEEEFHADLMTGEDAADNEPTEEEQREGIIDIDDLAEGIFKATDDMENESAPVPTSREVEEADNLVEPPTEEPDRGLGGPLDGEGATKEVIKPAPYEGPF